MNEILKKLRQVLSWGTGKPAFMKEELEGAIELVEVDYERLRVAVAQLLSCNAFSMLPYSRDQQHLRLAELELRRLAGLSKATPEEISNLAKSRPYVESEAAYNKYWSQL